MSKLLSLSELRLFVGDLLLHSDGVIVIAGIEERFSHDIDIETFFCSSTITTRRTHPAELPENAINRSRVLAR